MVDTIIYKGVKDASGLVGSEWCYDSPMEVM